VKGDIGRESECWQQVFHFSFRCEDLGFAFLPRIYTKREKHKPPRYTVVVVAVAVDDTRETTRLQFFGRWPSGSAPYYSVASGLVYPHPPMTFVKGKEEKSCDLSSMTRKEK
jgi:hypothetical protein